VQGHSWAPMVKKALTYRKNIDKNIDTVTQNKWLIFVGKNEQIFTDGLN
jgi:hypothetical protein